jgi:hypothetical protein
MSALTRIAVGVVIERSKAASQWIDFTWRAVAVLPGQPDAEPWTVLSAEGDTTAFYAGNAEIGLYPFETSNYRDNLASGSPSVWISLRPTDSDPPYSVIAATVDPAEGESFTEAGTDLVEAVPMPEMIRHAVAAFVAEHHVERAFVKRKRDRADPEALARRASRRENENK